MSNQLDQMALSVSAKEEGIDTREVAVSSGDSLLAMLERAARDPLVDVQKLSALLELKERVEARAAEQAFNEALNACQREIMPVIRDAVNPSTHSQYARLETVDAAIRPTYTRHGFSLSFGTGTTAKDGFVKVVCDLRHDRGHSRTYELEGALDVSGAKGAANKTSIQGLGSSVSYLRRYLTLMIFNVVLNNEDDDGNTGGARLSEAEVNKIYDMISACELDLQQTKAFLRFAQAGSVEEISQHRFPEVMEALRRKLAQKQGGA